MEALLWCTCYPCPKHLLYLHITNLVGVRSHLSIAVGNCKLLGTPSDHKKLHTLFLLDEENALIHSFNNSMDAVSHLVLDTYAKVTRSRCFLSMWYLLST